MRKRDARSRLTVESCRILLCSTADEFIDLGFMYFVIFIRLHVFCDIRGVISALSFVVFLVGPSQLKRSRHSKMRDKIPVSMHQPSNPVQFVLKKVVFKMASAPTIFITQHQH